MKKNLPTLGEPTNKVQIAKLRENGKPISAIVKEYGVAKSTISKWHHDYTNSGSFKASDNACAESIYYIVKTEFAFGEVFNDLEELVLAWFDYVNWYNNIRIHGSLGYMTPNAYSAVIL